MTIGFNSNRYSKQLLRFDKIVIHYMSLDSNMGVVTNKSHVLADVLARRLNLTCFSLDIHFFNPVANP